MSSILDIEETLNGSVVREHVLKLYEKAYKCILGVTIKFDEDNMPQEYKTEAIVNFLCEMKDYINRILQSYYDDLAKCC